MDALMHKMKVATEFILLQKLLKDIPGYLGADEGYMLFLLAQHGEGVGEIVEIGSFMGLSTSWLALGSLLSSRERVTAVDTFRGSPEHQPDAEFACETLRTEGTTLNVFQDNLQRLGVHEYVNVLVAESHVAAAQWTKPIRMLFIDGDHSYAASKLDFESWSPFIAARGYVAFHDINAGPGVTQFYNELIRSDSPFKEVAAVNSLRVLQKAP